MSTDVTAPSNAWKVTTTVEADGTTTLAVVSVATELCTWLRSATTERKIRRNTTRAHRKCRSLNDAHDLQTNGARIGDQDYWSGY